MAAARYRYFRLKLGKVQRLQKVFQVRTGSAAVEIALDRALEQWKNQVVAEATDRFIRSRAEIKDVYGKLDKS